MEQTLKAVRPYRGYLRRPFDTKSARTIEPLCCATSPELSTRLFAHFADDDNSSETITGNGVRTFTWRRITATLTMLYTDDQPTDCNPRECQDENDARSRAIISDRPCWLLVAGYRTPGGDWAVYRRCQPGPGAQCRLAVMVSAVGCAELAPGPVVHRDREVHSRGRGGHG
jgi:hypothetical protein